MSAISQLSARAAIDSAPETTSTASAETGPVGDSPPDVHQQTQVMEGPLAEFGKKLVQAADTLLYELGQRLHNIARKA